MKKQIRTLILYEPNRKSSQGKGKIFYSCHWNHFDKTLKIKGYPVGFYHRCIFLFYGEGGILCCILCNIIVQWVRGDNVDLGKKLLGVREGAGLTQAQLSDLLKKKGIDAKTYTISKWENGVSKPAVDAFLAICEICRVRDIALVFSSPKRSLRLYNLPVSAGGGDYLEGDDFELIEVDELVPDTADYAVRVNGNSMMPRFVDRQIVFIQEQPELEIGEIGIFCLNNDAYIKRLGQGMLISLNPDYEPIPIGDHDEFKIFGKVVG